MFDPPEGDSAAIEHVQRLWAKYARDGLADVDDGDRERAWRIDLAVIDGLGLGLEETIEYLFAHRPDYEEFMSWIAARPGGQRLADRIDRLGASLGRGPAAVDPDRTEPVLSAADLRQWDAHGYVVLRSAVSREACTAAEEAVWRHLSMDRHDSTTWYGRPDIWVRSFHHPAFEANRRSPRIQAAFAQLWGRHDLSVSTDRASFNPPETPDWQFPGPDLHWDVELRSPVPFGTQGLLYLADCGADQGAFTAVPGFHHRIDQWIRTLSNIDQLRSAAPHLAGAVPIPGEAGDLVIWHHALPHGSSPNRASRPRIVQYVNMYPIDRTRHAPRETTSAGGAV